MRHRCAICMTDVCFCGEMSKNVWLTTPPSLWRTIPHFQYIHNGGSTVDASYDYANLFVHIKSQYNNNTFDYIYLFV